MLSAIHTRYVHMSSPLRPTYNKSSAPSLQRSERVGSLVRCPSANSVSALLRLQPFLMPVSGHSYGNYYRGGLSADCRRSCLRRSIISIAAAALMITIVSDYYFGGPRTSTPRTQTKIAATLRTRLRHVDWPIILPEAKCRPPGLLQTACLGRPGDICRPHSLRNTSFGLLQQKMQQMSISTPTLNFSYSSSSPQGPHDPKDQLTSSSNTEQLK